MVYIGITDQDVLGDYMRAVDGTMTIAGPAAERLKAGTLTPAEIDWLNCNYLKNELELGHCLRLPEEGPCECDLYFSCPRFFTTREKAPRWRARRKLELKLAEDATARGWDAEKARHYMLARRCEAYLINLGEPIEDSAL